MRDSANRPLPAGPGVRAELALSLIYGGPRLPGLRRLPNGHKEGNREPALKPGGQAREPALSTAPQKRGAE